MNYQLSETISGYTIYEGDVYHEDCSGSFLVERPDGSMLNDGKPFTFYSEAVAEIEKELNERK